MKSKQFISGIIIGAILMASTSVFAENKTIDAIFNNIKITLNGKEIKTDVEPLQYSGRTYVPARLIAESLGAQVNWNEGTNTVEIASKASTSDIANSNIINLEDIKDYNHQMLGYFMLCDYGKELSNYVAYDLWLMDDEIKLNKSDYAEDAKSKLSKLTERNNWFAENFKDTEFSSILGNYSNVLSNLKFAFDALNNYGNNNLSEDGKKTYYREFMDYSNKALTLSLDTEDESNKMSLKYYYKIQNLK